MNRIPQVLALVQAFSEVFTKPTLELFANIFVGWVLCPWRRFVTSIYQLGDPKREHAHDAYHRFFSGGTWCRARFFGVLAKLVVAALVASNILHLLGDDTVHKKTGRKVDGAKSCRDAVRSTKNRVVYVWGLQIVLLCLKVHPPWGGEPLALPINMRLYRKRPTKSSGKSVLDLMKEMLVEFREWFPTHRIYFTADGFYAPLAKDLPEGVFLISRLRHDAALFKKVKPPKPGMPKKKGPPRKRGDRLPTPAEIAKSAKDWKPVTTYERGKEKIRLTVTRLVVWHSVLPGRYVKLVISRDPEGKEKDDFFFTTDLELTPGSTVSFFSDRWPIEDTFRNGKQFLGIEQPQSWKGPGPENVAAMGYAIYSLVWTWFIANGDKTRFPNRPWYETKARPSFPDALAGIRRLIWGYRIGQSVPQNAQLLDFTELAMECLARAA